MGQRSQSESIVKIFQAFLAQRTWRQPDLARHVGIQPNALRKKLDELTIEGVPLERSTESPTDVYWSVPESWFPGGAYFGGDDLEVLLRLLAALPEGEERDRLMDTAASCLSGDADAAVRLREVVVSPTPSPEARFLPAITDAARMQLVLRCRYYSEASGRESRRLLSVQRVVPGARLRFLAFCHRSKSLKWFRVDNVLEITPAKEESFVQADAHALREILDTSVEGYFDAGDVLELSFLVRYPEARWVEKNLPPGMLAEPNGDALRVSIRTAAVGHVARYVVGLGESATPQTRELAEQVIQIARGALRSASVEGESAKSGPAQMSRDP